MADETTVYVRFTVPGDAQSPAFTDAIAFSQAEYASATPATIAAAKAARRAAWVAQINAVRNAPPLTSGEDVADAKWLLTVAFRNFAEAKAQREALFQRLADRGVVLTAGQVRTELAAQGIAATVQQVATFLA